MAEPYDWKPGDGWRGLDFYRRWAEGMGGDEEQAMLQLVQLVEQLRSAIAEVSASTDDE